ncbi:hypothetical protein SDC9_97347 [bioreactor metagenome]|uniref:Uncharacterized protein n=1 Tax=bioreactor metagenome TaxID=1076179 RepID=A0A645ABM0_9ZZZZ
MDRRLLLHISQRNQFVEGNLCCCYLNGIIRLTGTRLKNKPIILYEK